MNLYNKDTIGTGINDRILEIAQLVYDFASAASEVAHEDEIRQIYKTDKSRINELSAIIKLEYLYLLLHFVSVVAFNTLGADGKTGLQRKLLPLLGLKIGIALYESDDEELINSILDRAIAADKEYAKCTQIIPSGDEPYSTDATSVILAERICNILYGDRNHNMIELGLYTAQIASKFHTEMAKINIENVIKQS